MLTLQFPPHSKLRRIMIGLPHRWIGEYGCDVTQRGHVFVMHDTDKLAQYIKWKKKCGFGSKEDICSWPQRKPQTSVESFQFCWPRHHCYNRVIIKCPRQMTQRLSRIFLAFRCPVFNSPSIIFMSNPLILPTVNQSPFFYFKFDG